MKSLKSFIKSVRAAKTLADERTVIQKESAAIRTSFREQHTSHATRRENVAKLLYLFTIGERTHFGQVECLKLLASPHFSDKRLGYLGTMLLLDENQEVLMLITNSLDVDLSHSNQYVVSLALCTLANIASSSMARDLFPRVQKLITSTNPNLKRKAALCALRIIRRVPELEEMFVEHCKVLIDDADHSVALCGASLAIDMLDNNPDLVIEFGPLVSVIISKLKVLSSSGYSPEYDVQGIPDPFLQTRLIRLLRAIGQDNQDLSEQMGDILAAVATNTDSTKNVGNAVLYEAVLAIFGIEADSSLRVLAINILGKFLSEKDNNSRYVALNTLLRAIVIEPAAVQRHRTAIIDCLKDPDISIRRRALELSFALINEQNVRVMVREILTFLETSDPEFKPQIVSEVALASERYAPNKRWHIDTLLRMFSLAGSYAKENILSAFILLVIGAPDLQLYSVQKLFASTKKDLSQEGLTIVSLWLVAEYADQLLKGGDFEFEDKIIAVSDSAVIDLILTVLNSAYATNVVQEYCINGLIKLSTRLNSAAEIERLRKALVSNQGSLDTEIQQRAVEYSVLIEKGSLKKGVLAKMPAPEFGDDLEAQHAKAMSKALVRRKKRVPFSTGQSQQTAAQKSVADLLDFGDDDAKLSATSGSAVSSDVLADIFGKQPGAPPPASTSSGTAGGTQNILSLFDTPGASGAPAVAASTAGKAPANVPSSAGLDDLFGGTSQQSPADHYETAYTGPHLTLKFAGRKEADGRAAVKALFENKSSGTLTDLLLQVSVLKTQQVALQPIASSSLGAGQSGVQNIRVTGPPGANLKFRFRVSYSVDGQKHQEQLDFAKFPKGLI